MDEAHWRGAGREVFADPTCTRPELISAAIFGAELATTLNATLTDRSRADPEPNVRRQLQTASGATIDINFEAARVDIAGDGYSADVTMLPDRMGIT